MAVPYAQLNAASYIQHTLPAPTPSLPTPLRIQFHPRRSTPVATPKLSTLPPLTASTTTDTDTVLAPLGELHRRRSARRSGYYRPIPDPNTKRVSTFARPLPFRVLYPDADSGNEKVSDVLEREIEYDPDDLRSLDFIHLEEDASLEDEAKIVKLGGGRETVAWTKAWLAGRHVHRVGTDVGLFPPFRSGKSTTMRLAQQLADSEAAGQNRDFGETDLEAAKQTAIFEMSRRQKVKLGTGIVAGILGLCLVVGLVAGFAAQ